MQRLRLGSGPRSFPANSLRDRQDETSDWTGQDAQEGRADRADDEGHMDVDERRVSPRGRQEEDRDEEELGEEGREVQRVVRKQVPPRVRA
jgi:hypothetical protein